MTRAAFLLTAFLPLPATTARPVEAPRPAWAFLDNGTVRIGVKASSGGAIAWFSPSDSETNLLNHFDHGRLVQQSYYGAPDGTTWNGQLWRWNPVQGGDWKGGPAKVLELQRDAASLSTRSFGRHWSGCVDLPDVLFEQRITLEGPVAHVCFRMTYSGTTVHPPAHQEIPAIFVEPEFDTLVLYDGDAPWTDARLSRTRPGWPNESRKMTERWAAYVNSNNFGLGAYVPFTDELTCYRYAAGKSSRESACSYFAPLTTFAITPGTTFEYDLHLTCGTPEEIRTRFRTLHEGDESEKK